MSPQLSIHPSLTRSSRRQVPLRLILVVPFVLQITLAVGVTAWLSLKNGQKTVNQLVQQLRTQTNADISHYLEDKLAAPQQINQLNLKAIQLEMLDLQDFDRMSQFFGKQMQLFKVGYINFANPEGEFIGVERLEDGTLVINETRKPSLSSMSVYSMDEQGKRIGRKQIIPDQPPVYEEDWYADTARAGRPQWSAIYQWDDKPEVLSISSSYPLFDQNQQLAGVIGVDLILSDINRFLQDIQISPNARTLIVERDGLLVGSSIREPAFKVVDGEARRLPAVESPDPLVRAAMQHLIQQFGSLQNIRGDQTLDINYQGNKEFLSVVPWQDEMGLNWLIVVIIPESDFMGQIQANTYTTGLWCMVALIAAILVGLKTSHWLTQPIRQLVEASSAIAQGCPTPMHQTYRIRELEQLSQSFNEMAAQIQTAFAELEDRVAQRTAELAQAKTAAEAASQTKSEFLARISHELRTPLNAILGFTQMMKDDPALSQEHQHQLAIIHRNGNHLLALINDILKVSRQLVDEDQTYHLEQALARRSPTELEGSEPHANHLIHHYLIQMDADWIEQLHDAAVKGSDDLILQLIPKIPSDCAPLADLLKDWTANFQFEHIIHLIDSNNAQ